MVYLSHSPPDGLPFEQQSSHGIIIPIKRTPPTSETITGCGCRCGGCTCLSCSRHYHVSTPDSNQETYGGQGTGVGTLSDDFLNVNASSLEAREPKNVIGALPSLELHSKLNEYTRAQLAKARTEQYLDDNDDPAPWRHFISAARSMTSDATETSGMFFPIDLEGSMENNAVTSSSHSMLSSYMSAMSVRSEAASAIVQHAGAALTPGRLSPGDQRNHYLKLL